ncbi:MAG TPA: hypothetical protein VJT75_05800 [Thermoleophilaceae bacterium]|nr:hypothetical protein [Thermoleophilaceae bacterium]
MGRECACHGEPGCAACGGAGYVGELVTLEEFRAMARVRARERPSLVA